LHPEDQIAVQMTLAHPGRPLSTQWQSLPATMTVDQRPFR
jgi:hypothetical protein